MSKHVGSTLDSFFEERGELEEVQALAAKKILAIQAQRRMEELGLTAAELASRMHTSRNQIQRILDKDDAGITLKVLFRLSRALGLTLLVAFESSRPRTRAGVVERRPAAGARSAPGKAERALPKKASRRGHRPSPRRSAA
jgi:transcriptional regulator with XRE-family HTH domain